MDIHSYGSAVSKVIPGTFVPDIAAPKSEPLGADDAGGVGSANGSFKDALKGFLNDVNDKQVVADQKSQDLALGKSGDFEGTVKSVEEAGLAMQFTLSVRNKLLEAYQEIQRMQV
ncbi:MAG: flagellar hook-basal body complex protein FliE [Candidatus Eremiobacteraeota bacterium]|nr:flagellar hook-basal body complex protein FliE [Candidatus Eremiobacteraeota bacterium]